MNEQVDRLARILWDYHHVGQPLVPSDVIVVLGSHDLRVAEWGAQVYLAGWAPRLLFSGGEGRLTRGLFGMPEAERFAQVARRMGVPDEAIQTETCSTNTGDNVRNTRALLESSGLHPQRLIAVHKPYMERRTLATFQRFWPQPEVTVTSPPITYEAYAPSEAERRELIHMLVGDMQRIDVYGRTGYQSRQTIPAGVRKAYEELVARGYTDQLLPA